MIKSIVVKYEEMFYRVVMVKTGQGRFATDYIVKDLKSESVIDAEKRRNIINLAIEQGILN